MQLALWSMFYDDVKKNDSKKENRQKRVRHSINAEFFSFKGILKTKFIRLINS